MWLACIVALRTSLSVFEVEGSKFAPKVLVFFFSSLKTKYKVEFLFGFLIFPFFCLFFFPFFCSSSVNFFPVTDFEKKLVKWSLMSALLKCALGIQCNPIHNHKALLARPNPRHVVAVQLMFWEGTTLAACNVPDKISDVKAVRVS